MSDTTATIVGPDGTPVEKPATLLTAEEAMLMREYSEWAFARGYQATMVCGKCGKDMECYVQGEIGIFCDCRVLYHRAS